MDFLRKKDLAHPSVYSTKDCLQACCHGEFPENVVQMVLNRLLFYTEGDRYPQVKVYSDNLHSAYPVEVSSVSHAPEPLGASYVRFLIQNIPGGLEVELDGDSEVQWSAALAGVGPPHEVTEMSVDGFGHGQGQVFSWSRFAELASAGIAAQVRNRAPRQPP